MLSLSSSKSGYIPKLRQSWLHSLGIPSASVSVKLPKEIKGNASSALVTESLSESYGYVSVSSRIPSPSESRKIEPFKFRAGSC